MAGRWRRAAGNAARPLLVARCSLLVAHFVHRGERSSWVTASKLKCVAIRLEPH
jgi:hypothetical protein